MRIRTMILLAILLAFVPAVAALTLHLVRVHVSEQMRGHS